MANYGDVALGLKASWNRNQYETHKWMLYTVGHTDGVSDVALKAEPDKQHQFRWVDTKDQDELTDARMRGYVMVTKADWTKNDMLWSWNAEGHIWHAGQLLMARDKERWLAENQRREAVFDTAHAADSETDSVPDGLVALNEHGQPRRKPGRPRKSGI